MNELLTTGLGTRRLRRAAQPGELGALDSALGGGHPPKVGWPGDQPVRKMKKMDRESKKKERAKANAKCKKKILI